MHYEITAFKLSTKLRLRPMPKRIDPIGLPLPSFDDWWKILRLSNQRLHLINTRTYHFFKFGLEFIEKFIVDPDDASRGCLYLKSQVVLKGSLAVFSDISAPQFPDQF